MTRRKGGSRQKIQRYYNIGTTTSTSPGTPAYIPIGARIIGVRGANQNADTFSYQVQVNLWTDSGSTTLAMTVSGVPNGRRVSHYQDWQYITTIPNTAPTAYGNQRVLVVPGTDTSVEVYYMTGTSVVDAPHNGDSNFVPDTVRKWLESAPNEVVQKLLK
jgi:hypothetical protein